MAHPPIPDPSTTTGNLFAVRLSAALAQRGLPLQRVAARLDRLGLGVSVATLSYWSSGRSRPARGRSLAAVAALESILDVEAGWFTSALLPTADDHGLGGLFDRRRQLNELLETLDLPSTRNFHRLMLRFTTELDVHGIEAGYRTEQVMRAEEDGIDSWAIVHDQDAEHTTVTIEGVHGARLARMLQPTPDSIVAELRLPRPLERGETAHVEYRISPHGLTDRADEVGFALTRMVDLLVLEVLFEGPMPQRVRRTFREPHANREVVVPQTVVVEPGRAHCVIPGAGPGLHALSFEWGV